MERVLYTNEQRAVVTASLDADLVVEAGPGAGKSRTAAGRIAWLLLKKGVPPSGVVAIAFTEGAAATLQERVTQILDEKASEQIFGLADLTVSTIHSFLLHLLQRHIPRFRKFRLFTAAERDLLLCDQLVSRRVDLRRVVRLDTTAAGFKRSAKASDDIREPYLTNGFEDRKCFLLSADVTREECLAETDLPQDFRSAFSEYRAELARRHVWDYSELLATALDTLNDTDDADARALQKYLSEHLRCVLVDEYNDVNPILVQILRRLRSLGVRVTAIGDADQTCFRFRGSDPRAFASFRLDFPDAEPHLLRTNHRSSERIVRSSCTFIEKQNISGRRVKPLSVPHVARQKGERGDMAALRFASVAEQDNFGIARLRQMHGSFYRDAPDKTARGLTWRDMMVLTRTNASARRIAAAVRDAGVPCELLGNENLLETPAAQTLAALFDYLGGQIPEWEATDKILAGGLGLDENAVKQGLSHLRGVRDTTIPDQKPVCLIETIYDAFAKMRFHAGLISATDTRQRELALCNVARVLRAAQAYQTVFYRANCHWKFKDFARWLCEDAPRVYEDDHTSGAASVTLDAVQIMTVHRAKGAEAPFVWLADLHENGFPHFGAHDHVRNPIWQVIPRALVPEAARYDGTLDDEARLMYVALTRPAKFLMATYGRPDQKYDKRGRMRNPPIASRYLRALEKDPNFVTDPTSLPHVALAPKEQAWRPSEGQATTLSFSDLLVYFTCPYQFRLRVLFGFPPAANAAIGYADSLHRCCARLHELLADFGSFTDADLYEILHEHFHAPNASDGERELMRNKAMTIFRRYAELCLTEKSSGVTVEQEVEVRVGNLRCVGRFDMALVDAAGRRLIQDWKTSDGAVSRDRELIVARLYALGFEARTGERVDAVGTRILSSREGDATPPSELFSAVSRNQVVTRLQDADKALAARKFPMRPRDKANTCDKCDTRSICLHYHTIEAGRVESDKKVD